MQITPVILAGGKGRRLRPLTSDSRPKPFLRVFSKYSLFQETLRRVAVFAPPIVVSDAAYCDKVTAHARNIGCDLNSLISEPIARSTAGAITLAALALAQKNSESIMAVMPSDHVIGDAEIFQKSLNAAADLTTKKNAVVFLGAPPKYAANSFGYIWSNKNFKVLKFIEKPNKHQAKKLIREPHMFWNTGVFCVRVQVFLDRVRLHAPLVYAACTAAHENAHIATRDGAAYIYPMRDQYAQCPAVAIDYAVMEHLRDARCVPLGTDWDDVGTFTRLINVSFKKILQKNLI